MRLSDFYDRHPISEAGILAALARRRGGDAGPITADDLFELDGIRRHRLHSGNDPIRLSLVDSRLLNADWSTGEHDDLPQAGAQRFQLG